MIQTIPREDSSITTEDWIYAASALDCEGTVGLSRTRNYSRKREGKYCVYVPYVIIANTNTRLTDWLYSTFGGYLKKRARKKSNWKELWIWRLGNRSDITWFLTHALPFMKLKVRQAEMLIEYFNMWHVNDPRWRESFFLELAKLNVRGLPVETNTSSVSEKETKIESDLYGDIQNSAEMTESLAVCQ